MLPICCFLPAMAAEQAMGRAGTESMTGLDIRIVTTACEDGMAIEVQGTIDVFTSPRFKRTLHDLLEAGHYRLYVNLEGVRDVDSSGLGVLIGTLKRVREHDGRLVLCMGPLVRRVFALTGLLRVFETCEPAAYQELTNR